MSSVIHRKGQRESKVAAVDDIDNQSAFVIPPGTVESDEPAEPNAKVAFSGRNVEIPEHYRIFVGDKLARLERYDPTIFRFDVELNHERNRRQSKVCQQVELTAMGKGPVVRAQACGENFYSALESALDKIESRLRRVKDRRKVHYGNRDRCRWPRPPRSGHPACVTISCRSMRAPRPRMPNSRPTSSGMTVSPNARPVRWSASRSTRRCR